nr:unnamed protein product [Haemonchus contortus]
MARAAKNKRSSKQGSGGVRSSKQRPQRTIEKSWGVIERKQRQPIGQRILRRRKTNLDNRRNASCNRQGCSDRRVAVYDYQIGLFDVIILIEVTHEISQFSSIPSRFCLKTMLPL